MRYIAKLPRRTRNGKRSFLLLSWNQKKLCTPKPTPRFVFPFSICKSKFDCFPLIYLMIFWRKKTRKATFWCILDAKVCFIFLSTSRGFWNVLGFGSVNFSSSYIAFLFCNRLNIWTLKHFWTEQTMPLTRLFDLMRVLKLESYFLLVLKVPIFFFEGGGGLNFCSAYLHVFYLYFVMIFLA